MPTHPLGSAWHKFNWASQHMEAVETKLGESLNIVMECGKCGVPLTDGMRHARQAAPYGLPGSQSDQQADTEQGGCQRPTYSARGWRTRHSHLRMGQLAWTSRLTRLCVTAVGTSSGLLSQSAAPNARVAGSSRSLTNMLAARPRIGREEP